MNKLPDDYNAELAFKAIEANLNWLCESGFSKVIIQMDDDKGRWTLKFN